MNVCTNKMERVGAGGVPSIPTVDTYHSHHLCEIRHDADRHGF